MKAVVITEPDRIEIREMKRPVPQPGEALLKVLYGGICGADLASYQGNQPFTTYPRIPGHEFSAEIVMIDEENEKGLKTGDLVTCNPYYNCGTCYSCRHGFVNCCEDNQTMGVQRDGAFCEYITVPLKRMIPGRGLDARTLALIEPFAIGYHAVKRSHMQTGDKVFIAGAGPIGLFAMLAAKRQGTAVYLSDVLDGRLEMARALGADGTINPARQDLAAWKDEITGGNGFDICMEACGLPDTFLTCIEMAAFATDLVLIGNGKKETTFLHSVLLKKELNVYGSRNAYSRDFEELIDLVLAGDIDIKKMISCEYPLSEVQEAFKELDRNNGELMKVLVKL